MAEFKNVIAEWDRMCEFSFNCSTCPLLEKQKSEGCRSWVLRYSEEAEKIIMQWAEEHPVMTNRRKFKEVFGFDVATMFEVNRGNAEWLDEEYEGDDGNDF